MDATRQPGGESSGAAADGQPPGQASAFRRALDAQVEAADSSAALVPTGPHDLTRPIDVNALKAALAAVPSAFPAQAPTVSQSPAMVVAPPVSVPEPRGPATVATPTAAEPATGETTQLGRVAATAGASGGVTATGSGTGGGDDSSSGDGADRQHSPRHSGGGGKLSRLPTAIGVSVLLAAIAGTALVLIDVGHSGGPLAPNAMLTRSAARSQAVHPSHPVAASHRPSPSPSASPSPSPSHSPSPSPSASVSPSASASFTTLTWTNSYQSTVADVQSRLARLRYLQLVQGGTQYGVSQRTMTEMGNHWWRPSDQIGFYRNATSEAIRAFKFDYLQHDQGQPPSNGSCDAATYQALVKATS